MTNPKLPYSADYQRLGHALALLRRKSGLTQVQAAERASIRPNFLSDVERGRRGIRWHNLVVLVRDVYASRLSELSRIIEAEEGR
jgi:transcriptional regulator with XRE-family HTH domain